jgi:hypothetical protein
MLENSKGRVTSFSGEQRTAKQRKKRKKGKLEEKQQTPERGKFVEVFLVLHFPLFTLLFSLLNFAFVF